jgi:hypothetical protein
MRHDCGYVEALRQLGVVSAWQPPTDADLPRWQIGWRGYPCLQILLTDTVWCAEVASDPPPT